MKLRDLIFLLLLMLASCVDDPHYADEKAVIDGWINSDGFPVVIFTSSLNPDGNDMSVSDKIVRWGKVTISDGDTTIIMTGGPDRDYFPPYRYITTSMRGEPGKNYKITAEYRNLYAEAQCEMPNPTPITSIYLYPDESNDSLRTAELEFVTPEDVPAYYYVTIKESGTNERALPGILGTYKAVLPSMNVRIPLMQPKTLFNMESYSPQFKIGERLEINLCRVTEEVYNFWEEYENALLFGGTQFFDSYRSLNGNVSGGYGVWSVQGVGRYYLDIE